MTNTSLAVSRGFSYLLFLSSLIFTWLFCKLTSERFRRFIKSLWDLSLIVCLHEIWKEAFFALYLDVSYLQGC
ncbi:uncharacterized protein EV420DRAFT_1533562 [Desarmillaria tabescens]|uniref:Uncharacterized protein n=1 Tax=Armillaria tabescens TaxID=1929756 RepID=A0AA39N7Y1_ARMTA|nr:uncharacterized protein EV420DRAFT_1533562 [Desarmillaria tabescens]KAK0460682.1 hypothetical protein EV420DRAFT_1533562 [Desarmillaria tabescens]